ncbi:MAG: YeeE/YedE family protein [Clostridiaceae bacterium]
MMNENSGKEVAKISMVQPVIAVVVCIAMLVFGSFLSNSSGKLTLNLFTGLALGYILSRARYGFAGGIKRIYITGEGKLTRALLVMFAISIIATAGIHWAYASNGALPIFRAILPNAVIPGTSSVLTMDIGTVLGGITFGIGMMIAGGCASGTLSDFGEGAIRAVIALFFFVIGSIPGAMAKYAIQQSSIGQFSARVYLPDIMGYVGSVAFSLAILLVLYIISRKYEDFRKKEGFYNETVFAPEELPLPEENKFRLFSYRTYHKFFVERWSFMTGGILLAIVFVMIIITTGASWGVTGPFVNWAVALFQAVGINFTSPALQSGVDAVNKGLVYDAGSLRNMGIIVGAALAMLSAGIFKFDFDFKFRDIILYIIGGLLMGFGARLAGGCNIGALYSGIANLSLSGWLFMASLCFGGIIGLKLFEGRVNIIPKNRHKIEAEKDLSSEIAS